MFRRTLPPILFVILFSLLIAADAFPQAPARATVTDTNTQDVASITVQVTAAPAHAEERRATPGHPEIRVINGKALMNLDASVSLQPIEAPQGTYFLVHSPAESGAVGYTLSPPGILEPAPGIHHLPANAVGLVIAVNPGTAKITIKGSPFLRRPGVKNTASISNNWSGYSLTTGAPFMSVTGSWTVPTVYGDAGDHSSTWIGIDGWPPGNGDLIQVGTEQDYSSGIFGTGLFGGPNYYAWWEVLPDTANSFSNPVSPGDHMLAIISLNGDPTPGSPMNWLIFLMNQTKNWTVTKNVTYSGKMLSADWVAESPQVCRYIFWCSVGEIADYGSATFDGFDFVNSLSPDLTFDSSIQLVQDGKATSTPSLPDGDSDGFTVAFGSQQPAPPGPIITTTSLPVAYPNFPYQAPIYATGASSFAWSASNLPSWLALDPNSGILSGTPSASGLYFFSVIARDASNHSLSSQIQGLSVTVEATPPQPDFSLSANPVAVYLKSGPSACVGSTTITIHPLYGFSGSVELTASGQHVGNVHFNPSTADTTSQLTFSSTLCHGGPDENLLSITGTSGSLTHHTTVDLVPQVVVVCDSPEARQHLKYCQ